MIMDSYIGITDFTNTLEIQEMLEVFKVKVSPGSSRKLHAGVMMSYKTLKGLPTKWAGVFPSNELVVEIFNCEDERLYKCLHFVSYKDPDIDLAKDLAEAITYGGDIDALQLDMIWPDPEGVWRAKYISRRPVEIILQVGTNAFNEIGNTPKGLVRRLREYVEQGAIDRVLLDKSMGRGQDMDAEGLLPYARAITNEFPTLSLVVAGGLGPDTMHLVEPLVQEFPDISVDAQGKLRPSGDAMDPIDWQMARGYLIEALKVLK